jgi:hypothetical protein
MEAVLAIIGLVVTFFQFGLSLYDRFKKKK